MDTKKTTTRKKSRTNTPRERGVYKSYSLRILNRDLVRLQKKARREKISFNTWILNALMEKLAPAAKPEEINDINDAMVVEDANGNSLSV